MRPALSNRPNQARALVAPAGREQTISDQILAWLRSAGVGRRRHSVDWPDVVGPGAVVESGRSEEHTSELQSLMRISYAVFCLKKKRKTTRESKRRIKHYKNAIIEIHQ